VRVRVACTAYRSDPVPDRLGTDWAPKTETKERRVQKLDREQGAGTRGLRPGPREPGPSSTLTRLSTPLKASYDARCVFPVERFLRTLRFFWISLRPTGRTEPLRFRRQERRTSGGERLTAPGEGEIPIKRISRRAVSRSVRASNGPHIGLSARQRIKHVAPPRGPRTSPALCRLRGGGGGAKSGVAAFVGRPEARRRRPEAQRQ